MIRKNKQIWGLLFITAILLTACTPPSATRDSATIVPPTVNPLYQEQPTSTPSPTILPGDTPTPAPLPTLAATELPPTPILNPQDEGISIIEPAPLFSDTRAETIFGDRLEPEWSVENSWASAIDLQNRENAIIGNTSIEVIPTDDFGAILFSVRESAGREYLRDEVLGLRFWLFTGNDYIAMDELIITMQGSNEYPYWVEDDNSIPNLSVNGDPLFSETQIGFLNISNDIPPNTWVNIELWLDERIYDPEYKYVTGFYIKNDAALQRPYYIDEVELLLLKDNGEE